MLFDNKLLIVRECERQNSIRRVVRGSVDHDVFFHNIRGDMLISGYIAEDMELLSDLITEYVHRGDMPLIILSGHTQLLEILRQKQQRKEISRVMISDPQALNYHPFYGLPAQQLLQFVRMTAEESGCHVLMDQLFQYASAIINIISMSYPVSLPAMTKLLLHDDAFISEYALQKGLSCVIADNIRGNHEAGIILRRVCEKLESVFEEISIGGSDTKYSFQSGVQGNVTAMALYAVSSDQRIMNRYLKNELFFVLKRVPKVRVVIDEMTFDHADRDELLDFLFQMKRQKKMELIFISKNAVEAAEGMQMNFSNVIMSSHDQPVFTEELSDMLWGTYQFYYPGFTTVKPPSFFPTLKKAVHWTVEKEERLRVRAEDLYAKQGVLTHSSDLLAVKTTANDNIYLIDSSGFLFQKKPGISGESFRMMKR